MQNGPMRIIWGGLGTMGLPMASRLLSHGHSVHPIEGDHGAEGASALGTSRAVPACTDDVLCLCLPRPSDVMQILEACKELPPLVMDFTSGDPISSGAAAALCREKGSQYVDCPISGSALQAASGTLCVFAGGIEPLSEEGELILRALSHKVVYFDHVGMGQAAKLTNQIVHISNMAVIGEGLRFAQRNGLPLDRVLEGLRASSASSVMLDRFGDEILTGNFAPRFRLDLAAKDMLNAQSIMGESFPFAPIQANVTTQLLDTLQEHGPTVDFSIIAAIEKLGS